MAVDPDIPKYRSGIEPIIGNGDGSERGTGYVFSRFLSKKEVSDHGIFFIRSTCAFNFKHNAFNTVADHVDNDGTGSTPPYGSFRIIGEHGLDGEADSGDEGIIRYRVDREGQRGAFLWQAQFGTTTNPVDPSGPPIPKPSSLPTFPAVTSTPLTFASLTYDGSTAVLGATGVASGYQRGVLDECGAEYHTIAVGDDDSYHEWQAKSELQSSDGKYFIFCVNPTFPAFVFSGTGNAEWITFEPKVYLMPYIHPYETVITPRSGTISLELRNIFGGNISYQIGAGSVVNVGASSVTLTDADFSTGSTVLQYWYTATPSVKKSHTIIKNPGYPSAGETHGAHRWGGDTAWRDRQYTVATISPQRNGFLNLTGSNNNYASRWDANESFNGRSRWSTPTSLPVVPLPSPQDIHAFAGKVYGYNATASGGTRSWGYYLKHMLLNNISFRIDPVDFERNQSSGSTPSAEVAGAGYYQATHTISALDSYDNGIANFREDQGFSDGITIVEDYYIRERLAFTGVHLQMYIFMKLGLGGDVGLWSNARLAASLMIATCMPNYSSTRYGKSGFGADTTPSQNTWQLGDNPTWKQIITTPPGTTIPYTSQPSLDYEWRMWDTNGTWFDDNIGYFNKIGKYHIILLTYLRMYAPEAADQYPDMEKGVLDGVRGELYSNPGIRAKGMPYYWPQPTVCNAIWSEVAQDHVTLMRQQPNKPSYTALVSGDIPPTNNGEVAQVSDKRMEALYWYRSDSAAGSSDNVKPTPNPSYFSTNPPTSGELSFSCTVVNTTDVSSPPVQYAISVVPTGQPEEWSDWQTSRTFTVTGLQPLTTFKIRCKARDVVGNETDPSTIRNFTSGAPNIQGHRTIRSIRAGASRR